MKKIILFILIIFGFGTAYSQTKTIQEYEKKSGFCSQSLKLYADSTYLYETGCEGRSFVNFGKWSSPKKGIIDLYPRDTTTFIFVDKVMESITQTADSTFLIKVIDQYGQPIKNFPMVVVSDAYDIENTISATGLYIYRNKLTNEYEFFEPNHTDEQGIIFSAVKTSFHIIITFPHDKIVIKYENSKYNTVSIKMALNREVFKYYDPKWIEMETCEFEGKTFVFKR